MMLGISKYSNWFILVDTPLIISLLTFSFQGDELEDYPDSPGTTPHLTGEATSQLLDADDATMEASPAGPSNLTAGQCSGQHLKRRHDKSSLSVDTPPSSAGPSLPPIYFSVQRKRLNKLAVRHLDGGACYVTEGTTLGAPVCAFNQIGSFANSGDKRHNLTAHRYDHTALRNISMSFDPCTFTCKSCQGAHQVLRRSIEESDVDQDNPPFLFSLTRISPQWCRLEGKGNVSR
jgi:hypothetical protein